MTKVKFGFTLVEVLLATGIMIVMLSMGVVRFRGYNQKQKSKGTMERVFQLFQVAKSNAQAGKKNCADLSCGGQNRICDGIQETPNDMRLVGWTLVFNPGRDGVTLSGQCFGGANWSLTGEEALPMVVGLSPQCNSMMFFPDGTTSIAGGSCVVTAGTAPNMYTVSVNRYGEITRSW